jgi:hypothetical protein
MTEESLSAMENPSKTPEMTDTQGEAPLYTQSTSTEEPPLPGVATPLPVRTRYEQTGPR